MITENNKKFISEYSGELTNECLVKNIARIKATFPALPIEFYGIISERFIEKGFSDQRLIDSVNNVIDNCQYPTPTMAQFLSYGKRKQVFSYNEMCDIVSKQGDIWMYYDKEKINDVMYWFKREQ